MNFIDAIHKITRNGLKRTQTIYKEVAIIKDCHFDKEVEITSKGVEFYGTYHNGSITLNREEI